MPVTKGLNFTQNFPFTYTICSENFPHFWLISMGWKARLNGISHEIP